MPDEGLWLFVVVLDVGVDGLFEFFGRAMHSTPQLFFRQHGEPTFDKIQPTRRSRCVVQMKALTFYEPVANQLGFMRAVVIQNQMHI